MEVKVLETQMHWHQTGSSVWISLMYFEENQKYDRIPTAARHCSGPWFGLPLGMSVCSVSTSVLQAFSWMCQQANAYSMIVPPMFQY